LGVVVALPPPLPLVQVQSPFSIPAVSSLTVAFLKVK